MSAAAAEQAFADLDRPADVPASDGEPRDPARRAVVVSRSADRGIALRDGDALSPSSAGLDLGDIDPGRRLLRVIGKGDRERRVPYGGHG